MYEYETLFCLGPIPDHGSSVYLTWPDHMLLVTQGGGEAGEDEEQEEEEQEGGGGGQGSKIGSREKEIIVYHSLANERAQHMVVMATDGGVPQVTSFSHS